MLSVDKQSLRGVCRWTLMFDLAQKQVDIVPREPQPCQEPQSSFRMISKTSLLPSKSRPFTQKRSTHSY